MGGSTIRTTSKQIGALQLQKSSYGLPIPIPYGTSRLAGNLVHFVDFKATPHTKVERQGGKGGSVSTETTTYTYTGAPVVLIGEGPLVGIKRVWKDNETIEAVPGGNVTSLGALNLEFATGEVGQPAWGYMATQHPDQAVPYSGLALVRGAGYVLSPDAGLQQMSFEVQGHAIAAYSAGGDANPADIVYDLLTNTRYGCRFPLDRIDLDAFRTYTRAANLLLSPTLEDQSPASEFFDKLFETCNVAPVPSEGRLKLVPYADTPVTANGVTFVPNTTPVFHLDDDVFLDQPPVRVSRTATADAKNEVKVEYRNRAQEYQTDVVTAQDQVGIEQNGLLPADVFQAPEICEPAVATQVANLRLQRLAYTRNTYTFRLGWLGALLEPMDPLTITDPEVGLERLPVRIVEIQEADADGEYEVEAEDFPAGAGHAALYPAVTPLTGDASAEPGDVVTPVVFEASPGQAETGLELFVAVTGQTPMWGGADVYLSLDNQSYVLLGRAQGGARYGTLVQAIGAADASLQVLLNDPDAQLGPATVGEKQLLKSLCWCDGEWLAYESAQLVAARPYTPGGLLRGRYDVPATAHAAGAPFVRVDDAVLRSGALSVEHIGKTIYLKFCSFNVFGGAQQTLDQVVPYRYIVRPSLGTVPRGDLDAAAVMGGAVITTNPLTATSAGAVSVNAFDLRLGGSVVHYNGAADVITGQAPGTRIYVYTDDPLFAGGNRTYMATTSEVQADVGRGRLNLGSVVIPGAGQPSGSGTPRPRYSNTQQQ